VKVLDWLWAHKALVASVVFGVALLIQGDVEVAVAVILAALSGGVKPVPKP
jgi:uncharacterized membrane protein